MQEGMRVSQGLLNPNFSGMCRGCQVEHALLKFCFGNVTVSTPASGKRSSATGALLDAVVLHDFGECK